MTNHSSGIDPAKLPAKAVEAACSNQRRCSRLLAQNVVAAFLSALMEDEEARVRAELAWRDERDWFQAVLLAAMQDGGS